MNGDNAPDEIWMTKDGRKLLVSEMTEEHVRNALRMVLRKRREARTQLKAEMVLRLIDSFADNETRLVLWYGGERL